jgi:hypothetical protein
VWKEESEVFDLLLEASVEREKVMEGGFGNAGSDGVKVCCDLVR